MSPLPFFFKSLDITYYTRVSQSGCRGTLGCHNASPGLPRNTLVIFGNHQYCMCLVKKVCFALCLISYFPIHCQLSSPKIADLQAHNVTRCALVNMLFLVNVLTRLEMIESSRTSIVKVIFSQFWWKDIYPWHSLPCLKWKDVHIYITFIMEDSKYEQWKSGVPHVDEQLFSRVPCVKKAWKPLTYMLDSALAIFIRCTFVLY